MEQVFEHFPKDIANMMIEYVVQLNYGKLMTKLLEKVEDYEYRWSDELHQREFYSDYFYEMNK